MVNKDMLIGEILAISPKLADILMDAGMHCVSCPASSMESLEEACEVHGIDVNEIIEVLNEEINRLNISKEINEDE